MRKRERVGSSSLLRSLLMNTESLLSRLRFPPVQLSRRTFRALNVRFKPLLPDREHNPGSGVKNQKACEVKETFTTPQGEVYG